MKEPHDWGTMTALIRAYQAELQRLLDDINADEKLNASDRVHLLGIYAESVKASLRQARKLVRGEEPAAPPTVDGQARKVIRRLCAEGKNSRAMSDSQLLAIGSVGTKTLEAIRRILEQQD